MQSGILDSKNFRSRSPKICKAVLASWVPSCSESLAQESYNSCSGPIAFYTTSVTKTMVSVSARTPRLLTLVAPVCNQSLLLGHWDKITVDHYNIYFLPTTEESSELHFVLYSLNCQNQPPGSTHPVKTRWSPLQHSCSWRGLWLVQLYVSEAHMWRKGIDSTSNSAQPFLDHARKL